MSEIDKIVAFNVLMRMRELGMDQKTLARKAKITAAYLNKLVKNKKPISKSPKLPDIAKAMNIDESKLYQNANERLYGLAVRLRLAMKDVLRKNHIDESFQPPISKGTPQNPRIAEIAKKLADKNPMFLDGIEALLSLKPGLEDHAETLIVIIKAWSGADQIGRLYAAYCVTENPELEPEIKAVQELEDDPTEISLPKKLLSLVENSKP